MEDTVGSCLALVFDIIMYTYLMSAMSSIVALSKLSFTHHNVNLGHILVYYFGIEIYIPVCSLKIGPWMIKSSDTIILSGELSKCVRCNFILNGMHSLSFNEHPTLSYFLLDMITKRLKP